MMVSSSVAHETRTKTYHFSPNFVPFPQRPLPLLVLLLQPRQDDRYRNRRIIVDRLQDLVPLILSVHFLDDSFVNTRTRSTQSLLHSVVQSLYGVHPDDPCGDRLEMRNRAKIRLDLERVPMSFLLRVVEGVLVNVLAMRSTTLRRRRSKGDPFVVQHRPFERISSRTSEIDFLHRRISVRSSTGEAR